MIVNYGRNTFIAEATGLTHVKILADRTKPGLSFQL
jgi:hypothetical protein